MTAYDLNDCNVLVMTETEFIAEEMTYYQTHFTRLGASVDFATNLWGAASRTLVADVTEPNVMPPTMEVSKDVADLKACDYDIVLQAANYTAVRLREIPPMHSHGSVAKTREVPAVRLFADAMRDRRIVKGALCHALWILTPCPELLVGRRVMCHTVVLADIHNAGAIYVPDGPNVVVDDDLVTGRSFADVDDYFQAVCAAAHERRRVR
jgi:protease I